MKYPIAVSLVTFVLISITATPAKSKEQATSENIQPLTYTNVVSHFKAAHLHVVEVRKRSTTFFESESKNETISAFRFIMVEHSGEDISVVFYMTNTNQMNWVTGFLDAPFFARAEREQLFDLISSGREAQVKRIGRFRVGFHRWQAVRLIVSFTFTPIVTNQD